MCGSPETIKELDLSVDVLVMHRYFTEGGTSVLRLCIMRLHLRVLASETATQVTSFLGS